MPRDDLAEPFAVGASARPCIRADAALNGLKFARHDEESAVSTFVRSIRTAAKSFQEEPLYAPLIPNWNRVDSALPHFFDDLRAAVRADNAA